MSDSKKLAVVALILQPKSAREVSLVETLSDEFEISALEGALQTGAGDPLVAVREARENKKREEEDFADYVEELLAQPFLRPEIREHGVQWLKSKIRIEKFQASEAEATRVIAEYALRVFHENPERTDFILAGPHAKVRIRVFALPVQAQADVA